MSKETSPKIVFASANVADLRYQRNGRNPTAALLYYVAAEVTARSIGQAGNDDSYAGLLGRYQEISSGLAAYNPSNN